MKNYQIIVQYDGSEFCGWQIQKEKSTVQGIITEAISKLLREEINLIGAGRTDAGVHAFGQSANFRCEKEIDLCKFKYSLNSILPKSISINKIEEKEFSFHSRFDAIKRIYYYFVCNIKSPFYYKYSYFYYSDLTLLNLNRMSKLLSGEQDFSAFEKEGNSNENSICNIMEAHWSKRGDFYIFRIEANRFLRGMVRAIVGTMLKIERNNGDGDNFKHIIEKKDRKYAGDSAPAQGLFLYKVRY